MGKGRVEEGGGRWSAHGGGERARKGEQEIDGRREREREKKRREGKERDREKRRKGEAKREGKREKERKRMYGVCVCVRKGMRARERGKVPLDERNQYYDPFTNELTNSQGLLSGAGYTVGSSRQRETHFSDPQPFLDSPVSPRGPPGLFFTTTTRHLQHYYHTITIAITIATTTAVVAVVVALIGYTLEYR